jgi:hypothetical protein
VFDEMSFVPPVKHLLQAGISRASRPDDEHQAPSQKQKKRVSKKGSKISRTFGGRHNRKMPI